MLSRSGDGDMVCVVTTVKDTPQNLDRFVEHNLAGGADHLFMYVDDADESTYRRLSRNPHVTAVRTGAGYWHGHRPRSLNRRQWVNANLTNLLLTAFPQVQWLFHLDGDEELDLDRHALMSLPPEVRAVRLRTLESVASASARGPSRTFKRPLAAGELDLLTTLGVIRRPSNKAYFHGHTAGKSGIRPSPDLRIGVHNVETLDIEEVEPFRDDRFNVLHCDAWSPEEFVRKWTEHLDPDNTARFRNQKERLRSALATLGQLDVPESVRRELLLDLYRRHVEDDVELLDKLGFLVVPEPSWHQHRPRQLPRTERGDLESLLEAARELDKRDHSRKQSYEPRRVVTALADIIGGGSSRERLLATLTEHGDDDGART